MGSSNWSASAYSSYSSSVAYKTRSEIFTNDKLVKDLNPSIFTVRESRDSEANPESTPIIIGVDVTGSMGHLAELIVKKGLGVIMENIIKQKPVSDPHVLLACIGDATCDSAPFQATQFEADVVLVQQIEQFFLEGRGGGNMGESYLMTWWFAMNKTVCDAFIKRNRKGYLFTIGDERCLDELTQGQIKQFFGVGDFPTVYAKDLIEACRENWNLFHLIVPTEATKHQGAISHWRDLLGQSAVVVEDWEKLPEVIVSIMRVNEGESKNEVENSWDEYTREIVSSAIAALPSGKPLLPEKPSEVEEI